MSQLTDFFMIMGAWLFVVYVLVAIVNWLSAGFFTAWFRVRVSQGKKWLIKVWTEDNKAYYAVGKPDGSIFRYKDRSKSFRRVSMVPEAVYRSFGCDVLETDEAQNGVRLTAQDALDGKEPEELETQSVNVRGGFRSVSGFDAKKMDNLILWALTLPRADKTQSKIMFIMIVLNVLLSCIIIYLVIASKSGGKII